MVLEATMLVLDNSEWMRNGDYTPSRWEAQGDAVNVLFNAKTNSNPENMVGLMTMAGKSPKVLVTLTQDIGKVLSALHESTIDGSLNLSTGINVAQLALKHRQNKNQRQRVVVFIGSPVADTETALVQLGKKLKKNSVAVDVISFGEDAENEDKLAKFVESANSGENSHLLTIPAGPRLLSDIILSSPILSDSEESGAGQSGASGSGTGFEFGVDPSMDPELAMALRMSLEEEQARQRVADGSTSSGPSFSALPSVAEGEEARQAVSPSSAVQAQTTTGTMVLQGAEGIAGSASTAHDESEDAMLQKALALSQSGGDEEDTEMQSSDAASSGQASSPTSPTGNEEEDISEEDAIARAIEMSLKDKEDHTGDL